MIKYSPVMHNDRASDDVKVQHINYYALDNSLIV